MCQSSRVAFLVVVSITFALSLGAQPVTYDVEIVFTGMTAVVLQVDPQSNQKGPIDVMVMNAREPRPNRSGDPHAIHEHVPYILSARHYLKSADNSGITLKNAHNQPQKFHYMELLGETIEIDRANIEGLNPPLSYITTGAECPTSDTKTSLRWLPSMRDITQDVNLQKDTDYFSSTPSPRFLAATMFLDEGTFGSAVINQRKWQFKKKRADTTATHTQAIAQEAILSLKATGDPFVLKLRSFDQARTRSLVFRPDMTKKKLVIVIANTTEPEIGPLPNPTAFPTLDHDPHFPLFYEFVACNPHKTGPVPFKAIGLAACDPAGLTLPVWMRTIVPDESSEIVPQPIVAPHVDPAAGGANCGPVRWP